MLNPCESLISTADYTVAAADVLAGSVTDTATTSSGFLLGGTSGMNIRCRQQQSKHGLGVMDSAVMNLFDCLAERHPVNLD